jgi:hypothetical protein
MEPLVVTDRPAWMDEAACKGRTTLFFGLAGSGQSAGCGVKPRPAPCAPGAR